MNDYKGLFSDTLSKKAIAYYKKRNFDLEKYVNLHNKIEDYKHSLASFGVYTYLEGEYPLSDKPEIIPADTTLKHSTVA